MQVAGLPAAHARSALPSQADPGSGPGPTGDLDFQATTVLFQDAGRAVIGLIERYLDLVFDVLATLRAGLAAEQGLGSAIVKLARPLTGAAAENAAEKVRERPTTAKQILGRAIADVVRPASAGRPARPVKVIGAAALLLVAIPVGAQVVVFLALFRVGQDLVGLVDLFEAFLGLLVVRVDVGVVFARQASIGALDLLVRRALVYAQDFVVISILHACLSSQPSRKLFFTYRDSNTASDVNSSMVHATSSFREVHPENLWFSSDDQKLTDSASWEGLVRHHHLRRAKKPFAVPGLVPAIPRL